MYRLFCRTKYLLNILFYILLGISIYILVLFMYLFIWDIYQSTGCFFEPFYAPNFGRSWKGILLSACFSLCGGWGLLAWYVGHFFWKVKARILKFSWKKKLKHFFFFLCQRTLFEILQELWNVEILVNYSPFWWNFEQIYGWSWLVPGKYRADFATLGFPDYSHSFTGNP